MARIDEFNKGNKDININNVDIIKILLPLDGEKFFLQIFLSEEKNSIIYQLEKDTISDFYYYQKYFLQDLYNNFKKLNFSNINDIYIYLKSFINSEKNFSILNKDNFGIKISVNKNFEKIGTIILKKKFFSQNKLNPLLAEKIQENNNKLNLINNRTKNFEEKIKQQNEIINNIKARIEKINTNLEGIVNDITSIKKAFNKKNINNNIEEKADKNNKNNIKKKPEIKCDNRNNKKNNKKFYIMNIALCDKKLIYELILVLNIFIVIFISYIFLNSFFLQNKGKNERKITYDKKYDFIDVLEKMNDYDLSYIQYTFDTGNYLIGENEKDDEDDEYFDKIYENKHHINFKDIIQKSKKKIKKKFKKKIKTKNNKK